MKQFSGLLFTFFVLIGINHVLAQNRVGIDTIAPRAGLHVGGLDGLLVSGEFGSGSTIEAAGEGTRLFFNPRKAAFRVGRTFGTSWNDANVGEYSMAWGAGSVASGNGSTAWGSSSTASGDNATSWGFNTIASGAGSTAWGFFSVEASGIFSTAWGSGTASGDLSTAFGGSTASAQRATAWGVNSEASGEDSTSWGDNTLASGGESTAFGSNSRASGTRSTAWGDQTLATGNNSTAWGTEAEALSFGATAWGTNTEASGTDSTAWGADSVASGGYSTAWGIRANASGGVSTAWGSGTSALSGREIALGSFNTLYTPIDPNNFDLNDRLFIIGNGTSNSSRSDAMVVLKNGDIGIGRSDPDNKLEVAVTTNATTPNGDGLALYNTDTNNFWNIHMSPSFLRFSANNVNVSDISSTTGAYNQTSDRRLKENIIPLNDKVLEKLLKLNTYKYNYKRDKTKTQTTGVIAQELKELFPEFVSRDEGAEYYGVNYAGLSVIAIKGIQQQQEVIDNQKDEIDELKAKNEVLEKKINKILKMLEKN